MESASGTGSQDNDIHRNNTRAGMNFHYYRGDDGEIYFDDEPEGGKPEWMEKADRKQRNRRSRKTIKR